MNDNILSRITGERLAPTPNDLPRPHPNGLGHAARPHSTTPRHARRGDLREDQEQERQDDALVLDAGQDGTQRLSILAAMTKHLQLLKDMFPHVRHVACLMDTAWNKDFAVQASSALEQAAPGLGLQITDPCTK
jgi:hypothetical protein